MKEWFKKAIAAIIEARQLEANARIAAIQLYNMTDRELRDIGIGRGDIKKVAYDEVEKYKNKSKKENVSWWQYINRKFGGKLHQTNHA
jgi:uncharacterized protein YjiS (DUF1127 family)